MRVTNKMRERWQEMTYYEKWHDPAFCLKQVEEGIDKEAGEGYFAHEACRCPDDSGDCEHCQNTDEFSSRSCEICGTPLAGSRHALARIHPKEENLHYSVCGDCHYYVKYGVLDDQTMLDIEDLYGR